jgi:N-6 DNA Methylase
VFAAVPAIAQGLLAEEEHSPANLAAAFDHALVLLYRLLFCLHAEARGLLPVENPHYERYSLTRHKRDLAADIDARRVFSNRSDDIYNDLRALFRMVDTGDEHLGVNEYNGGLFDADRYPYFQGRSVADNLLSEALDRLYRVNGEFVDYRDLSVRHLGTIYERLLDFQLIERGGTLTLEASPGRRESGSYFTPAHVVDRIVELTVGPVIDRRARSLGDTSESQTILDELLRVRVADAALGSGHFLVGACAYLTQRIASELDVRAHDATLDRREIRRLVAERCLYGVDVNPLAVELAQLSLWLTTVTEHEPLAFLHNLRVGNSLVGASVEGLLEGGDTIFGQRLARAARDLIESEAAIASRRSARGDDVHEKDRIAEAEEALRAPLLQLADEAVAPPFSGDVGRLFHWELEFQRSSSTQVAGAERREASTPWSETRRTCGSRRSAGSSPSTAGATTR